MANEFRELLLGYDVVLLKAIAQAQNIDIKGLNKEAIAVQIARRAREREYVERALAEIPPVERELLARVQLAGGEAATSVVKRVMLRDKLVQSPPPKKKTPWGMLEDEPQTHEGNPHYKGKPTLEDAVAHLTLKGLLLSREVVTPYKQVLGWAAGRYLVIPKEILSLLPAVAAPAEQMPEPARMVAASARNLQRDLSRYWSYIRRLGRLDLQTQGWIYKKTLTELLQLLGWKVAKKHEEKTDLHLYFLRKMLLELELLVPEKRGEWLVPDGLIFFPANPDFWSRPPVERIKATFEAWRDGDAWNELRVPPASYGSDHRRPAPPELKEARRIVLQHVKKYGAGRWVALDSLREGIRLGNYEFLFPRLRRDYGYFNPYQAIQSTPYYQANNAYGITYRDIKDEAEGWDTVEGAIIEHILAGPLHWLGLTDLGYDKDGNAPVAYRLTGVGAWLLGIGGPVSLAVEGGRVVVQPNFQIIAMEPISEDVLMTLDTFAQFEGGDNALTYRLTRESVYRGQRAGWDASRIVSYLEQATGIPLAQNVRRSLEEWQLQHERITIRRGVSLLQAEDPATLDALFARSDLSAKLGRRAAGSVTLLDATGPTVTALRDAGWFPIVTLAGQVTAKESVTADENGQIEMAARSPSIYAYGEIEPYAEMIDERHARITPESVRAAVDSGLAVPEVLARLQKVFRGPIPPKLVQRIKAWGRYYGNARLGQLTLIEFRDEAARAELLQDSELKPYLTQFDAGARPLALVKTDDLERLQELFAERGIEVKGWS
ncbi:MAG: helicase-associated domain-containing protein [Anaerolineae bacterium]